MPLTIKRRPEKTGPFYVSGTLHGVRIRKSLGTHDRGEAEKYKAEIEARIYRQTVYGEAKEATFEDAALNYLKDGHEGRFVAPLLHHFRGKNLADIRPVDIREAAKILYPDAAPATLNRQVVGPCRAIINHAADNGMCPPIRVKQFPVAKPKRVAVGADWIIAFRTAAADLDLYHLGALCWFLFETGTRISEATRLTPEDMDYEKRSAFLGKTKNGDEYHAYFSEALRDELQGLTPRNGKVFGYKNKSGVYNVWKRTCEAAEIAYVPPHQAGRHSLATMMNAQGYSANDIASAGRWKSVRLVQETYVHAENVAQSYVGGIGDLIKGGKKE